MTALDVWRLCGKPVNGARPMSGCTCNERDPSPWLAAEALNRLNHHYDEKEAPGANRSPRPASGPRDDR